MTTLQDVRAICARAIHNGEHDFTVRQLGMLAQLYAMPSGGTVRGLAATLGVGKPVITRATDSMTHVVFCERRRDPFDGRNVIITLTPKGRDFMGGLLANEDRAAA